MKVETTMSSYLHVIDGRLRIKVPEVKRTPHKATDVVQSLRKLEGVSYASANPTTGNVLVIFEPEVTTPERIVEVMREVGCFQVDPLASQRAASPKGGQWLTERFLQSVFETALQHVLLALI
jgi:copper chaperone CopZ